jgi:methylmalonyl-CoA mutase cobalamin-binding domain/chain
VNIKKYAALYLDAVHDTDRDAAGEVIRYLQSGGIPPEKIVFDVITPSLKNMIEDFYNDKIILSQHFIAVRISEELIDYLLPLFTQVETDPVKIILGSASGDFHALGKKIVAGSLKAKRIEVLDLGLNISAEKFVDVAVEENASIIGVSSMMVHTATGEDGPRLVRKILDDRGLSSNIKLIVGGAPYLFDEEMYHAVGADAWGRDGIEAAEIIRKLHAGL